MIFADGRAALGDFGASRFAAPATRAYTEAGTFGYIAPEQAYGRARFSSDVFSLGLIAYEVLTGFLPTWPFEWPPDRYRTLHGEGARAGAPGAAQGRAVRSRASAMPTGSSSRTRSSARSPRWTRTRRPRRGAAASRAQPELSPLAVSAEAFRRAHGRGLELRYRCHRCDGPIAEPMTHCPWCGSAGNSFAHLTSAALVCPDCEKGVRPEWKACPWCYAGRFEGNGRRAAARPEGRARVQPARLRGPAAPVHALLPAVQAQGEAGLVARRPARPLPALPLAHVARLLPLLPVVRAARAARGELPRALARMGPGRELGKNRYPGAMADPPATSWSSDRRARRGRRRRGPDRGRPRRVRSDHGARRPRAGADHGAAPALCARRARAVRRAVARARRARVRGVRRVRRLQLAARGLRGAVRGEAPDRRGRAGAGWASSRCRDKVAAAVAAPYAYRARARVAVEAGASATGARTAARCAR